MKASRISVGVLERSPEDAEALSDALLEFYPDQVSLSLLADAEQALTWARRGRPGVLLGDREQLGALDKLPDSIAVGALVDVDQSAEEGVTAVCRYLAVDAIYAEIVRLFSEVVGTGLPSASHEGDSLVVAFTSPQGGVGTTTVALAFARKLARSTPDKVLYLDLTPFAVVGELSAGRGSATMTDVVFAAKSRNANMRMALTGTALRDESSGLWYYASARTAADVMELGEEELTALYQAAVDGAGFRYVILDVPFAWSGPHGEALARAGVVVAVTDGRPLANYKLLRAVEALDLRAGNDSAGRSWTVQAVFYNKYSSTASSKLDLADVPEVGGSGALIGLTDSQVVEHIAQSSAFDLLLGRVVARVR
ncbi:MAG: hypothetical protein LBS27_10965 [Bifidobacteriaceae bacterium]|nr:hypothetical protein [Bifidobacteriaceae bacterium]